MSVTQTLGALGAWNITLNDNTPQEVLDAIQFFGHIVVDIGDPDRQFLSDGIIKTARYVGQLSSKEFKAGSKVCSGSGMLTWLGDTDQKGQVFENPLVITNKNFHDSVVAVMPTSVQVGTIFNTIAGTLSTTFQYTDPKTAMDYVTSTMGGEYRVNNDATLDAGLQSDLYRMVPVAMLVGTGAVGGADMHMRGLEGTTDTTSDVQDFTTRVLLIGQGDSGNITDGSADINPTANPYRDFFNNPVKLTRMVSETGTEAGNATQRAQLQLNRFSDTRDALTLSTQDFDVIGEQVNVGDQIYVYDPETGLVDFAQEVVFRGERYNPLTLRLTEMTWPIVMGMTIAYRDSTGKFTDLTPYVNFETGETTLVVGGYSRTLTTTGGIADQRPILPDASVPAKVVLTPPFVEAVYQSPTTGATRAQTQVTWNEPLNTDGSVIQDGDHYEVNWRQAHLPIFASRWDQVSGLAWNTIKTAGGLWSQPLTYPVGDWNSTVIGWDQLSLLITELLPSHPYEVRVRAVDSANPPNFGEWSNTSSFQTSDDTIAPSTPAPPICDTSLIAVQVTHFLGVSTGGNFNLDSDVHHLEVHAQYEPTYQPDDSTMLGKMLVNYGMIAGQIPVVATFQVNGTEDLYFKVVAVDEAGNKSTPSAPTVGTPDLIDDQHISTLTASKITAGTITSDILLAGSFKTGLTGARTEIDSAGIRSFNAANTPTFNQNNTDGSVSLTGSVKTSSGGARIEILPDDGAGQPRIDIYDNDVTTHVTQIAFSGNYINQRETNGTRANNGGFIVWDDAQALYGMRAVSLDIWASFDDTGRYSLKGSLYNADALGGETVFWCWAVSAPLTAGNASATLLFGATMAGFVTPFCSIQDNTGVWFSSPFSVTATQISMSWQRPGAAQPGQTNGTASAWVVRRT